ncbi:MAG TPA: FAD-dependent oxidoreductase, partial [Gammaproteobacteria bacterium]
MTNPLDERPESDEVDRAQQGAPPDRMDRRRFFRGAAALTVGGLSATAGLTQPGAQPEAAAQLETQTSNSLRWIGNAPANWVRARAGADHNVVIVGGGQSGLSIAYQLRRKGVGGVDVIDQAEPGRAGIWRNIARMHQLRTPKTLAGPELGNAALSFRAWYETRNGVAAFDALDRIPTPAWADYIDWFRQTTGTMVRYRTRLVEIEPQGDLLRLHLEVEGAQRIETTRKVVLANGYAGAGGPNVPDFLRALPPSVWTHTTGAIPFAALDGKVVGVVGAGSSAFDAAAVALESGAAEVHMFSRRSYIDYPVPAAPGAPPVDRGYPNVLEQAYDLPDVVR